MFSLLYLTLVMSCIIGSFLCCHLLYLIIFLIIPKVEVYSYESDYDSHSCKSVLAAAHLATELGPHCSLWCLREPNLTFGKLHIWGVATWENTLGKLLLRKKVPNTCRNCFFSLELLKSLTQSKQSRIWSFSLIEKT